jgi:threonine dehydratase
MRPETSARAFGSADVQVAAGRLKGNAHRTPVLRSSALDAATGASIFFKAECLQRTGSFKFRGAFNAIAALTEDERARGVCAFSSGNHAQAVALAARLLGTTATVLMPEDAPAGKRSATEGYGGRVIGFDRYTQDRMALADDLAERDGLTLVAAFDNFDVMAGQGTAALELVQEVGTLDTLVVPVSGGGLIAGSGVAARSLLPRVELIGAEPQEGNDTALSLNLGERVRVTVPRTIADALQAETPGRLTFPLNQALVDAVLTVSDDDIVAAMRLLFERLKIVVEPSGAAAFAALVMNAARFAGKRVGVILSGGNVSTDQLALLFGPRQEDS